MPKSFMNILGVLILVLGVGGCAVSKSVKVQSYFDDKERVDQSLSDGNQGFLQGTLKEPLPERKATRKIFVIEVSKEAKVGEESQKTVSSAANDSSAMPSEQKAQDASTITTVESSTPVVAKSTNVSSKASYVEYVVDKDDTLQKIAKKFYDNYNKWTKIYDENKSLIKNPDRIQPGITLRIPME